MVRRSIEGTFKNEYPGFCGWTTLDKTLKPINDEEIINIFDGIFQFGWSTSVMAELYGSMEPTALVDNREVKWR